jgi:TonB-linked SusC/RagA family outer membrane protein
LFGEIAFAGQVTASVYNESPSNQQRIISVHFEKELLADALHELARKVKVGISYETETVPSKLVTYEAENKAIFEILNAILEGTGLFATLSENRKVILIKEKQVLPVVQQETITGTVTDASSGETIPGVNILVKGTSTGAATDTNGEYELTVESLQDTLVVSYIGYQTKEVPINDRTTIDVELNSQMMGLEELVVTGTGGPVKRESVGHTISTVKMEGVENLSKNSVQDALLGKVSGVSINNQSGSIDQEPKIRIRGTSSLSMTNQPLIYVDGIRVTGAGGFAPGFASDLGSPSGLANINFDSIERVEILKGPAAATLYGSQANAGVIQIFTKKGSRDTPPQFDIELSNTFHQMPDRFKSNWGFVESETEQSNVQDILGLNVDFYEPFESPVQLIDLYSVGLGQELSTSVRGGGEGITYYTNLRYSHTDGPFDPSPSNFNGGTVGDANDLYNKFYFTGNLNFIPTDAFNIRVQTSYTNANTSIYGSGTSIYNSTSTARYAKPEHVGDASEFDTFGIPIFATVREGTYPEINDMTNNGRFVLNANYFPTNEITIDASLGIDYKDQRSSRYAPFGYAVDGVAPTPDGSITIGTRQQMVWTFEGKANWTTDVTEDLRSSFVAGVQYYKDETNFSSSTGTNFSGPGLEVLGATESQSSLSEFLEIVNLGAFFQEQLDYKEWLYFTTGLRLDASSAFGADVSYATYPKFSLSFLPFRAFDANISGVSTFRLRGAWGQSGQQPGAFDRFTTYVPVNSPEGSGVVTGNIGNQELEPEIATEWEGGFELGFAENRVMLEATYWDRIVEDALVDRTYPPSGGFTTPQLTNAGELAARGVELSIDADVIQKQNFNLNVFAHAAYTYEKINSLGGGPPIKIQPNYIRSRQFIKEGYSPAAYFGTALPAGIDFPFDANQDGVPDNQNELESYFSNPVNPGNLNSALMVAGPNGDALPGGSTYLDTYLGKPTPDWEGAFGFSANLLANFTVSTRFQYAFGNYYHHNLTGGFRRVNAGIGRNTKRSVQLESILKNPASTTAERIEAGREWVNEMVALSPFDGLNEVEKADYIRWSNLSISYSMPKTFLTRFGVNNASLTATGNNIALWTKYGGVDPLAVGTASQGQGATLEENFQAMDTYGTPLLRSYTLTLKFDF